MPCVTAITPMQICCSYNCAVTQHQCSAALLRAKCIPHCPVMLCKTGSQHALCHCSYTYAALLLIQLCSDPTPMLCSTAQGKMQPPLSCDALQNRLTACPVSLQLHLCRFAFHTGVHCLSTNALQQCSGQNTFPTVLWCSAKQAHSMPCVTAITPMQVCCSYRCAVTQHQCSAALVLAKCIPHCPVMLCKTGSQHALCHCNYTYAGLLLIQVCSDPTPMLCSTAQGKMQPPLSCDALQNRLTACPVSLQLHLCRFAAHTGVQ